MNHAITELSKVIRTIQSASGHVREANRSLVEGASNLTSTTTAQASATEEITATVSELSKTVASNAANADRASAHSETSAQTAAHGMDVMKDAVGAMDEIKSSSDEITNIIAVIESISFQTNLLALNASVEAARAGDAGRGFAVVAEEVRTLSQSTAEAAKSVSALIVASQEKVEAGAALVHQLAGLLEEISALAKDGASLTTSIAAASREQVNGLGHVRDAMSNINKTTLAHAELADSINAIADRSIQLFEDVDRLSKRFTVTPAAPEESPIHRAA